MPLEPLDAPVETPVVVRPTDVGLTSQVSTQPIIPMMRTSATRSIAEFRSMAPPLLQSSECVVARMLPPRAQRQHLRCYFAAPPELPEPIDPLPELEPVLPPLLAVPRTMPFWQAVWNSVLDRRPSLLASAVLKSLT